MDVVELIKSRRTIREFSDRIPSRDVIRQCLDAAVWAPNPMNQQPWKFYVVTGAKLDAINDRFEATFFEKAQGVGLDEEIPPDCEIRKDETMLTMARALEEGGADTGTFVEKMVRFFDAPVVVLFAHYRSAAESYRFGTTAALENFLLAAHSLGLGTCWLGVARMCQDEVKPILSIPPELELLGGVGIGYPAENSSLNSFERSRTPHDELTVWCGFDQMK